MIWREAIPGFHTQTLSNASLFFLSKKSLFINYLCFMEKIIFFGEHRNARTLSLLRRA